MSLYAWTMLSLIGTAFLALWVHFAFSVVRSVREARRLRDHDFSSIPSDLRG